MSSQKSGWQYLVTYSGKLKIIEEACNLTIIITLAALGYELKTQFLNIICILGFLTTAAFIFFHIKGIVKKKSQSPWHWSECIFTLTWGIFYVVFTTFIIVSLTPGYITTAILGYVTAIIYWADTVDKYSLATTPRKNYVWTTPNMPDLNVEV